MQNTKTKTIDFTVGSLKKNMLYFALPLFLGNLFQQLYNTMDSLIVGNTLGKEALASVSSSSPLIFMITGFFNGVAMGAGVVISKYFGAKDYEKMKKAIHTDLAFGICSGLFITVFGVLFTPFILRLMKTPEDILLGSISYFRNYSLGILFCVMYNICMGIMNATGDSKHPLYYLIISSCTNVVLDLVFIKVFHFGVGSAATATVISQGLSFILAFIRLVRTNEVYKVKIKEIRFSLPLLKEIVRYGLPSGVQNSVIAIANLFVQTNINTFSSTAVAGSGAYLKVEGFVFIPITSFSMALTTCISQNLGAKNYDRAKKGAYFGIFFAMVLAETIGLLFYLFAPGIISLFNREEEVIAYGVRQARTECLFYFLLALSHSVAGVMRGCGKATVPMLTMLFSWCLVRVSYLEIALHINHTINLVYWAYPITWSLSSIIFIIYMFTSNWTHGLEKKIKEPY